MSYYSRKNKGRFANRMPKYERDIEDTKNITYAKELIDEDRGIKRIVQYVDDPEKSYALARVRKMSETSKSRRNSPKNSDEELENTEKNRLLFKEQKYEEEEPVRKKDNYFNRKKVHFGEKNNNNTIDNIKIKRITDIDDYKAKNNTVEPKEQVHTINEYKPKKNRIYQTHENTNQNEDNDNNRNVVSSYRTKKNRWNDYKYDNKSRNENSNDSDINNYKAKFNTIDNDYDLKNAQVIESHHNKDKIVVNEYRTHSQDKRNLKNYKIEYVWDKNINRLVEKRIYLDEDPNKKDNKNDENDENENEYKYNKPKEYSSKYGNRFNRYGDKNNEEKYDDKFTEEPKEDVGKKYNFKKSRNYQEFKKPIRKNDDDEDKIKEKEKEKEDENEKLRYKPYRRKYNQSKPVENKEEEKPKEKTEARERDSKSVEVRKRFGNCQVIFKKINKDNKPNDGNKNNDKTRFYRKEKLFPINNDKEKEKEKPNYQIKNNANNNPMNKIYKKRQFILEKDDDFISKIPKTSAREGKKYSKRPQNSLLDDPNTKVVYSKKIIDEKKPDKKEVKEILIEQNYNDDKDPNNVTKKNIRIQITTENLDDEGDDKIKNKAYKRYTKGKDNLDDDKFRKKDIVQSVDDINEIIYNNNDLKNFTDVNKFEIKPGEFGQDKPYYKKEVQIEEITETGPNDGEVKTFTKTQERYEEELDK